MYCKAGVQCTNPEVYGDIKRGRRLAPSKGIVCPRCQGKCCNDACMEKHKCKQRARQSASAHGGRVSHNATPRWPQELAGFVDPSLGMDPMTLAALRGMQASQGLLLPGMGGQQYPGGLLLGGADQGAGGDGPGVLVAQRRARRRSMCGAAATVVAPVSDGPHDASRRRLMATGCLLRCTLPHAPPPQAT